MFCKGTLFTPCYKAAFNDCVSSAALGSYAGIMLLFLACRGELLRRNQRRGQCVVAVAVAAAAAATAALALRVEAFPLIPAGRSMAIFLPEAVCVA